MYHEKFTTAELENKIEELEEEIQILKNDMERIIGARNG
mgnify:CR=1 FL=1